jgi:hypothetical protein
MTASFGDSGRRGRQHIRPFLFAAVRAGDLLILEHCRVQLNQQTTTRNGDGLLKTKKKKKTPNFEKATTTILLETLVGSAINSNAYFC